MIFLASVDMDGLKYINDTYGHAEGDYAIKATARILQSSVQGHNGICARFGGDEYMVAIVTEERDSDINFYDDYELLLQKRVERFNKRGKKPYQLGVSVGTLYGKFGCLGDVDRLMKKADDSMYRQKCEHHSSRTSRIRESSRAE
jgi:diguanylate cyclase (GGDEF)-like protein